MNSVELAQSIINRAKNLQTFEVRRMIDGEIFFNGRVPFDIRVNNDCAWFTVYAVSQTEAENQVDSWLNGRVV